jgi:hypothetical protein
MTTQPDAPAPQPTSIADAIRAAQEQHAAEDHAARVAAEQAEQQAAQREHDRRAIRQAHKRSGLKVAQALGRAMGWTDDEVKDACAPKSKSPSGQDAPPGAAAGRPRDPDGSEERAQAAEGGSAEEDQPEGFKKRKTPVKALRKDCPVIPLGVMGGTFHYLDPHGQLRSLKGKDHNAAGLRELFLNRIDWLWDAHPKFKEDQTQSGWKADEAGETLIKACSDKGVFNPLARVRGVGGWRDDQGGLILHAGDAVLIGDTWQPPGEYGGYIYPADDRTPRPGSDPATRAIASKLLARLDSWHWRGEKDDEAQRIDWDGSGHCLASILYLGWLMSSLAGAALSFRPVLWLTADAGEGKTTLIDLTQLVLSGGFVHASDATEAGVSSSLGYSTKAVLLDESEDEGNNRRVHALIKLARQAASGGGKLRGSSDHQAHAFNAKSSFLFGSIIVPSLPPADASRICILKMAPLEAGAARVKFDPEEWRHVGQGLRRRLMDGWQRWEATFDAYREGLATKGFNPRGLDQMGTLLAMADLARFDDLPDSDTVLALCEAVAARRKADDYQPNNTESMLNHLLSIPLDVFRGGERMTIGELVARAAGLTEDAGDTASSYRSCQQALRAWSIFVDGLKDSATVVLPHSGEGLRKLFEGTHWRGEPGVKGGWAQALERLPGVTQVNSRRFAGRGQRVPVRTFLMLAEGETLTGGSRPAVAPDDDAEVML